MHDCFINIKDSKIRTVLGINNISAIKSAIISQNKLIVLDSDGSIEVLDRFGIDQKDKYFN